MDKSAIPTIYNLLVDVMVFLLSKTVIILY